MSSTQPAFLSVTDKAVAQIKNLLVKRDKPSAGVRIGVKTRGCSGLAYTFEYADEVHPQDEVVNEQGITLLVAPQATMFLLGTEIDYQEDKLQSGFVFHNPNEKGRCGCGESFHV